MIPRDPKSPTAPPTLDNIEELESEARDQPNDHQTFAAHWSPPTLQAVKSHPNVPRRESLLTRQLHSETEHTDDELPLIAAARTARTHSTWSNPSTASTAELTSDDGHSVASPSVSPPFPASNVPHALPLQVKPLDQQVKIVGQEDTTTPTAANGEKTVEAGLGRKRCITFACRGKPDAVAEKPVAVTEAPPAQEPAPQQKKCSLRFVCPSRPSAAESKPLEKSPTKRASSPPPPQKVSTNAKAQAGKVHRGSDSTITHPSPKNTRRTQPATTTSTTPIPITTNVEPEKKGHQRKYSTDSGESDDGEEAVRFHEFGTSDEEPEDWVQESTCHRSRLTVSDTLKKENVIRKACEEVEEEAVEEDEEAEEDLDAGLDEDEDVDDDDDAEDDIVDDDDDESDEGFHSDDEQGFANSDDEEDDDSDLEWWRPGGISTAATSVEHLDRLAIVNSQHPEAASSVGSASSAGVSPHHRSSRSHHRSRKSAASSSAVPIDRERERERDASPGLPDSTDFVCGTLDEDRPLEQAYLNRRKIREAAKHKMRPQDIDPSFPTSDPEMDEEDDEDLIDPTESEHDGFLHGKPDEAKNDAPARKVSPRGRHRSNSHRSPPPPAAAQHHVAHQTTRYHSPAPPTKKKTIARSPPPPSNRKLFGRSPRRMRSPAPHHHHRMVSPPNSPTEHNFNHTFRTTPHLAQRSTQPTRTASLPRRAVGLPLTTTHTNLSRGSAEEEDDEEFDGGKTPTSRDVSSSSNNHHSSITGGNNSDSDTTTIASPSHRQRQHHANYRSQHREHRDRQSQTQHHRRHAPTNKDGSTRRAAIDIVKGLDKKRQFRREKLYQKRCAAAADKPHHGDGAGNGNGNGNGNFKPGRGAERMRAIGLGLQNYHGKAEHILSL